MAATKTPPIHPRVLPQRCAVLRITSPVFTPDGGLPLQYTADGANINPSFDIGGVPAKARCLGTHHYRFTIYALDTLLDLPRKTRTTAFELLAAIEGHILGWGSIAALYKRK